MSRIVLSPRAKTDLSGIWDYTLEQRGIEQAESYVRQLWAAISAVAENPAIEVNIGEVRKGYRKSKTGSHVIFFKQTQEGIDVVRILHQSMDFERHL